MTFKKISQQSLFLDHGCIRSCLDASICLGNFNIFHSNMIVSLNILYCLVESASSKQRYNTDTNQKTALIFFKKKISIRTLSLFIHVHTIHFYFAVMSISHFYFRHLYYDTKKMQFTLNLLSQKCTIKMNQRTFIQATTTIVGLFVFFFMVYSRKPTTYQDWVSILQYTGLIALFNVVLLSFLSSCTMIDPSRTADSTRNLKSN